MTQLIVKSKLALVNRFKVLTKTDIVTFLLVLLDLLLVKVILLLYVKI